MDPVKLENYCLLLYKLTSILLYKLTALVQLALVVLFPHLLSSCLLVHVASSSFLHSVFRAYFSPHSSATNQVYLDILDYSTTFRVVMMIKWMNTVKCLQYCVAHKCSVNVVVVTATAATTITTATATTSSFSSSSLFALLYEMQTPSSSPSVTCVFL